MMMKKLLSWILTVGGVAVAGAGLAGHLNERSSLHKWGVGLAVAGALLVVVGVFLGREAKVAQQTTIMMQRKQKRNYQVAIRLLALVAAAAVGYFLFASK